MCNDTGLENVRIKTVMKKILFILICVQFVFSCNKDEISGTCGSLRDGILSNDVDRTGSAINNLIDRLPNKQYNETNLTILVQKISSQCNVTGTILCFDCIQTLPSQSEIRIVINSGTTTVAKTIDIDYASNNVMTFRGMHD